MAWAVAFLSLVVDQVTKQGSRTLATGSSSFPTSSPGLTVGSMPSRATATMAPWLDIRISYVTNGGLTFGWLDGHNSVASAVLFYGLSVGALLALSIPAKHFAASRHGRCGVGLVAAGVVGNLIDRAHYGYVIDWLTVRLGGWGHSYEVPTFNVADWLIVIGGVLLAWSWHRRWRGSLVKLGA